MEGVEGTEGARRKHTRTVEQLGCESDQGEGEGVFFLQSLVGASCQAATVISGDEPTAIFD